MAGQVDPQAPGDEKNFTPPADAPDTFTNEGPGGFAQNPEQNTKDDTYAGPPAAPTQQTAIPRPPTENPPAQPARAPSQDMADTPDVSFASQGGGLSPAEKLIADHLSGKGMSPAGIAGFLGMAQQESASEGGFKAMGDPDANGNYTSYGFLQWHGARAAQVAAYAQAHGLNPFTAEAQLSYLTDKEIMPGGSEYDGVKSVWGETDPGRAAATLARNFERSANPSGEGAAGGAYARQVLPQLTNYLASKNITPASATMNPDGTVSHTPAQQGNAPQAPGSNPAGLEASMSKVEQMMGRANGQGRFDSSTVRGGTKAPVPATSLEQSMRNVEEAIKTNTGDSNDRNAAATAQPGTTLGSVGTAFMDLLRGAGSGIADRLGMPADLANAANWYFASHPKDAALMPFMLDGGGAPVDWGNLANKSVDSQPDQTSAPQAARNLYIPLGSEDLKAAAAHMGVDLSQAGQGGGSDALYDMGNFIGAGAAPTQLAKDAAQAGISGAKTLLGHILVHNVLMPAGVSGGMDLGRWGVDQSVDNGWLSPGVAQGIGIAGRMALGGAMLTGMARAGGAREMLKDSLSPGAATDQVFRDDVQGGVEGAGETARQQTLGNLGGPNPQLPEGYTQPTFVRTSNLPLQQLAHNTMERTLQLQGLDERNVEAMEAVRPEGDAQDAVTAIQNSQRNRDEMITQAVANARDTAQQKVDLAAAQVGKSTTGLPLGWGGQGQLPQTTLAQSMTDQLHNVNDLIFAHADDQWDVARDQGHLDAQAPAGQMMRGIQGVVGDSVAKSQGSDLPMDLLNDLYVKGKPTDMFDPRGRLLPGQQPEPLFKDGDTTIGDLQNFASRIGARIRQEQRAISGPAGTGSPQVLRRLAQIQEHVNGAIQQGAVDAGGQTQYAVQNALDATRQAYGAMVKGSLGRAISQPDGPLNAADAVQQYLGNSNKAIAARDYFTRALTEKMGLNAMAAQGTDPETLQQHFWNTWADWTRQSYMQTAHELGTANAGQKWLNNHQGVFDAMRGNPVFDQLETELRNHATASADLPETFRGIDASAERSRQDIENNAQALFLNGDGPKRLDTILQAPSRVQGGMMKDLIGDTLADQSGNAFNGLKRMVIDRVLGGMKENSNPLRPGAYWYSFNKGQQLLDAAKPALDALGAHDPDFASRIRQLVAAGRSEDVLKRPPGLDLPEQVVGATGGTGAGIGTDLATRLFRIGFSRIFAPLLEGGGMAHSMQAVGQTSAFGAGLARRFSAILPAKWRDPINALDVAENTRAAIKEALMDPDPEKLRGLLGPRQGPSGGNWARGVEPWLRASGVMLPQGPIQEQGGVGARSNDAMTMSAPASFAPPAR